MVQPIQQSFATTTRPVYQGGGFGLPTNGMPTNAMASIGQNPTLAGTNPTLNFSNMPNTLSQKYLNMGIYDEKTKILLEAANGGINPALAAGTLGLKPPTITTNQYGFAQVSTMTSMALGIGLDAAEAALQTDPTTGQPKDLKGFLTLMKTFSQDPKALLDPRMQQLAQIYQQLAGTLGAQAGSIAGATAGVAGSPQLTALSQQVTKLTQVLTAITTALANPENLNGSGKDLAQTIATAMQSATPATPTTAGATEPTTQETYNKLLANQINPKATG